MTLDEYQSLACRTSQWQPTHPNYRQEEHRTYGEISLAGESGELVDAIKKSVFHGKRDNEKILNECGDVAWSVACLCEVHGLHFDEIALCGMLKASDLDITRDALDLFAFAAESIKWSQRSKIVDLGFDLANVIAGIVSISQRAGSSLEEVLAGNVAKLRKRYPDGYSDAASIARADVEGPPTLKQRVVATVEKRGIPTLPEAMGEGE